MEVSHSATTKRLLMACIFFTQILFYLAVLISPVALASSTELKVTLTNNGDLSPNDPAYFYESLLRLALEKTRSSDGDFVIEHNNHGGGIERDRAMLVAGAGLDVMWGSVTKEREQKMHVIHVNLLKALNNYRVLLIRKEDQKIFNNVNTLDDLKKLRAGSGLYWTDGVILKDNGISVLTATSYKGLFKMLAAHRFDFISSGLYEIDFELENFSALGLALENTILLEYDNPVEYCYFVNKDNVALASRIERGLKIAQQDGSFDSLFLQIPSFRNGLELIKHQRKTLIQLHNKTNQ